MKNKKAEPAIKKVDKPMTEKDWLELMGTNRHTYNRDPRSTKRAKHSHR